MRETIRLIYYDVEPQAAKCATSTCLQGELMCATFPRDASAQFKGAPLSCCGT
jgi:hypothetical protein